MKSHFLSVSFIGLLTTIQLVSPSALAEPNHWKNIGPDNNTITAFAIDQSNQATLYAGTYHAGVHKSTNGGVTWSPINVGIRNIQDETVKSLVIDPSSQSTIYIKDGDLYKSTNSGGNWIESSIGFSGGDILFIDPSKPSTIYSAGEGSPIYKSVNGGDSWGPISKDQTSLAAAWPVAIFAQNPSIMYAVSLDKHGDYSKFPLVKKSTTGGENWTYPANIGIDPYVGIYIRSLAIDPSNSDILFAGTQYGVLKSTNGGENWKKVLMTQAQVATIAIDHSNPATIYVGIDYYFFGSGGEPQLFKSTDGGESWSPFNAGFNTNTNINTIVIDPLNSAIIYAGTSTGVFRLNNVPRSTECLFDWAEKSYPSLFSPANPPSDIFSIYTYRYYSATNTYLGVSSANNHVYYLDYNGALQDAGPLSNWLSIAGC